MAITYPYDLLDGFKGHSVEFELLWRQEQSRQANGRTILKDFGSPLWRANFTSAPMHANDLDAWRARLAAMENGLKTFKAYPISRYRPINHPGSGALPNGTINSISSDRKTVTFAGLASLNLTVGDMFTVKNRDLHQIVDVSGGSVEVRPHLWPGIVAGDAVSVSKPFCIMAIVPGSIASTADMQSGIGAVSFQAVEAR